MGPSGDGIVIRVVTIIISLGLSALFSSSETAPITINKVRIRALAEEGSKSAQWMIKLSENRGKMLSVILIGNNVVDLPVSSMLTMLVTKIFGNKAAGAATGVLTPLILTLDEITSKAMVTLDTERYPLRVGHMVHILMTVLILLIVLINWMSLIVLKVLHVDPNRGNNGITEDELRIIVDVGHEKGIIESKEREMINNVFNLGDSVVRNVMVPRIDMVFVDIEVDYDNLTQIFREEYYTRLPVYKETTDNVVDIISIRDLLLVEDKVSFCVSDYLRQPFYIFESEGLSELMMEIKKSFNSTIIVLGEYDVITNLITLEDILEEIVGDIRDEYNEDEEEELVSLRDGQYLVEGSMKLDDLNDILDSGLSSEDYDPMGGPVTDRLEYLPSQGEEVVYGNVRLVVEQVEKNRIDRVCLYILPGERKEEWNQGEIKARQLIKYLHFGIIYTRINRCDKKQVILCYCEW